MSPSSRPRLYWLLLLPMLLFACASPTPDTPQGSDADALPLGETDLSTSTMIHEVAANGTPKRGVAPVLTGESIRGIPITCSVLGNGPDTTFLLAAIHGDEDAGAPLLEMLITHLHATQRRPQRVPGKDGWIRRRRGGVVRIGRDSHRRNELSRKALTEGGPTRRGSRFLGQQTSRSRQAELRASFGTPALSSEEE